MVKLGELLLLRAQLQKELAELTSTFEDNAQHEEGSESTMGREALAGYLTVQQKVERIQVFIQATNAVTRFDEHRTMMEVLLQREMARKQIPTLTSMLRHATSKSFGEDGYGRYGSAPKPKYVPAVDVPDLRRRLADVKALAQQLDVRIQARNWEVDVVDPFAPQA